MPITVQSRRFGTLEVAETQLLHVPHGLVGLPGTHYALVPSEADSPFWWLQSTEDPDLALPVCDPFAFFGDFVLELSDAATAEAGLPADGEGIDVWVTVRASGELQDFAANLRGPIVVHAGTGHQVVNEAPGADVRAPLFAAAP